MDRSRRLGEESIPRLLLTFSFPAIVGMLAQAIYNVVDRAFVGQAVGPLGIAGATVSFPFMLILLAFGMLIGFGSAALVSIRLGEQRKAEAEHVLGNALVLLVGVGLLLTLTGLVFLDPILTMFGASREVLPLARGYLRIIVLGSTVQCVAFGLNAIIRGEGNPRMAMYTMLIGALLNTILDPIFIFHFGWGMQGAAAATVTAQVVSAVWVLSYFLGGKSLLKIHAGNLRLRRRVCGSIVAVGSPMFAMQIAASLMNAVLNNQLRIFGGDLAISVMGIIYAVALFIAMPIFGINQGAQPIIGYNHGARRFDRVKKTLLAATLFATVICVSGFLVVMLFPSKVIWLFNREDEALMRLGTRAIRICLVMFPIIGFQIVSTSYFQAVGKPKQAMLLGLSRQVILLIPAILILPHFFGLDGIWAALPVADATSSIWTAVWLSLELRHLRRQYAVEDAMRPDGSPASPPAMGHRHSG
jgi:putative MATE family efflux protein